MALKQWLIAFMSTLVFLYQCQAQAPYDPSPFNMYALSIHTSAHYEADSATSVGTINSMTVDAASGPLAGGSITVDGVQITVPTNLIATLPANEVAWPELFVHQPNRPAQRHH